MIHGNKKIRILLDLLEEKDPATKTHSINVMKISLALARELGITNRENLDRILTGSLLHDVGKLFIPDEILLKETDGLTDSEYETIKKHTSLGAEIIKIFIPEAGVEDIVCQHHERIDGEGYPEGIKGEEICFEARICSVADAFETIRSGRIYCEGRSLDESVSEIEKCSKTMYDPKVVGALVRCAEDIDRLLDPTNEDA